MAWLSGLADKAENLLNKIDKNTAAVLSKDKNEFDQIIHISSVNQSPQHDSIVSGTKMIVESPMRSLRSTRNDSNSIMSSSVAMSNLQREEELITYLNTPSVTPSKSISGVAIGSPTPSSLIVEHSTENSDSISDQLIQSGWTSPEPLRIVLDLSDNESSNGEIVTLDRDEENSLLRREIEKLRNELIVTSHVEKSIENEHDSSRQKLETLRREYEYRLTQQRLEMERLIERSKEGDTRKSLKAAKQSLLEKTQIMSKQQIDHQKEISVLREKLRIFEIETAQNIQKLADMQTALERSRSELNGTRIDLEQHRARALKTLQEKEKLIAELRNDSSADSDNDTMITELNQLRQECEVLRDENQQVREQLRVTREELINADLKLEEMSRKSIEAGREAQVVVSAERRKRIEAEEDARVQLEEVRGLRDELESQLASWSIKIRKQETEITRLRSQLSAASTPSSAVESRLSSLTQTLVSKQQALESLTTEKNALRLQLEKIEQEYRKILANSRKNGAYNSVNDTDDAKAQVPTFFMETPFDTGVARRVKRAYSTFDAISVRTGVFLRRYPLARIFVIIYIASLNHIDMSLRADYSVSSTFYPRQPLSTKLVHSI